MRAKRPAITRAKSAESGGNDKELLSRLGRAVKLLRVSKSLSQRELAGRIGISQNYVWSLESGKKDPGILLVKRIAAALDMPIDFFIVAIAEPRKASPQSQQNAFMEGRQLLMSLLEGIAADVQDRDAEEVKKPTRTKRSRL